MGKVRLAALSSVCAVVLPCGSAMAQAAGTPTSSAPVGTPVPGGTQQVDPSSGASPTTTAPETGAVPGATQAGGPPPASNATPASDEIVVTARRREEGLFRVPVTVSALSGQDIAKYNAPDLSQIGDLTPTVIIAPYKANGGGSIAIRGISTPATQAGFEQAVSVSIDGVQTSNGRIASLGFFDLQQVEVMKGPQALFFGKNSSAGVIALTSAGPTDHLEMGVKASYEFVGDEAMVEGYVSGPLTPTLGARVALRYRHLDGWFYNDAQPIANPFYTSNMPAGNAVSPGARSRRIGDAEFLGRGTLVFDPSSTFKASLKVFGSIGVDQGPGSGLQNIGPCPTGQPKIYGIADPFSECSPDNHTSDGALTLPVAATMYKARADGKPYGRTDVVYTSLNISLKLGSATLASTTGYSNLYNYGFTGLDSSVYSQLATVEESTEQTVSQELRLSGNIFDNLSYMVGGYGQLTNLDFMNISKIRDSNYNPANGKFESWDSFVIQKGRTVSAFAELQWEIVKDLELAGGLRWTDEHRRFSKTNAYGVGANNTINTLYPGPNSGLGYIGDTFHDTNFSPEVTLTYHPTSQSTLYGAYKTGFKSGGYGLNVPLSTTSTIADFDFNSEVAKGLEVGAKGEFLNRRLRLTSALFAYRFNNLQVTTYDASTVTFKINNAGAVVQRGGEVEGQYRVGRWLTLRGAATYVHNRFENYVGQCYGYSIPAAQALTAAAPPGCSFVTTTGGARLITGAGTPVLQQDFAGRAPPRSPDWAGSGGFDVTTDIGNGNKIGLSADAFYSGQYYAGDSESPASVQNAFWRFNASARLTGRDDRWEVSLIGRNLTNKYYLLFAGDLTGGTGVPLTLGEQRGVVARGREISLQFGWKFR